MHAMDGWMDGWMDGGMDACMHACMHGCMDGREGGIDGWVYTHMHLCMCEHMHVCMGLALGFMSASLRHASLFDTRIPAWQDCMARPTSIQVHKSAWGPDIRAF